MFLRNKSILFLSILMTSMTALASESLCIEKIKNIADSVSSDDVLFYDYARNTWVTSTSQQDHLSFGRFDSSGARNIFARSEEGACTQEITRNTALNNNSADVISHYLSEVATDVENDPQISNTFGDMDQYLSSCQPFLNASGTAALQRLQAAYSANSDEGHQIRMPSSLESEEPNPAVTCSHHLNNILTTLNLNIDLQYYQRGNSFIYQNQVDPVMLVSRQGANQLFHSGQTCGDLKSEFHSGRMIQDVYEKILVALEKNQTLAPAIQQDWAQASQFCAQVPRTGEPASQAAVQINSRLQRSVRLSRLSLDP